ncbi:unnamed protein product, partial [Gongylonema pulchrum]|uniref:V-SNARE coiled-coil homology domain-containing protein n=1 Tax=Gongylonema pulchrum TaxID=637853 RepID=A0A183E2H2_9BILA
MFYVFYVNEGSLHALEVSVALCSVHNLQCAIEKALLISGGEGLLQEKQVSHYRGAGTESNPVFLFRKLYKDGNKYAELFNSLFDELRNLDSAPVSRSVVTRYREASRLGLKIAETGLQHCGRLVQDHQLLHHGWLALISNLCESRTQIDKKSERFFARYERLKTMRTKAESLMQDFDSVLHTLQQIKIPSSLLCNSCKTQGGTKAIEDCTLYDYIARADPQNSLEEMTEQTNDAEYKQVTANMKYVNELVNNPEMRHIRGMNTRLTQLDSMFHKKGRKCIALVVAAVIFFT